MGQKTSLRTIGFQENDVFAPAFLIIIVSLILSLVGCTAGNSSTGGSVKQDTAGNLEIGTTGDILTFGHYEQDGDLSNGPEDIEWIIVSADYQDGRAMLLCNSCLEYMPFIDYEPGDEVDYDCSWGSSTLRAWLNTEFLATAFSEEEQPIILESEVETDIEVPVFDSETLKITSLKYITKEVTNDKVFIPRNTQEPTSLEKYEVSDYAFEKSSGDNPSEDYSTTEQYYSLYWTRTIRTNDEDDANDEIKDADNCWLIGWDSSLKEITHRLDSYYKPMFGTTESGEFVTWVDSTKAFVRPMIYVDIDAYLQYRT